jgi:ribosomal protein S27E
MSYRQPAPNGVLARETMQYTRHQPEKTLLYQVIEEYYPAFLSHLSESGKTLPQYVQTEFEEYLKCGCLEHGFLRVQCESCHQEQLVAFSCKRRGFCPSCGSARMVESAVMLVDSILPHQPIRQWVLSVPFPLRWLFASEPRVLGKALEVVTRAISTYLVKKAGFTHKTAKTGAVTLIQRFGSALNLNIHFHMLYLDGVYEVDSEGGIAKFHANDEPTLVEMNNLLHRISERIARLLEREGYLERDSEDGRLLLDGFDDDVLNELQGSSITYRIAVGSQRGKKVFTLKTLPVTEEADDTNGQTLAKGGGFSLHAGVSAKAHERAKIERLCRYIARPAVSTHRLERLPDGKISYELKTPYKNGTTHVLFEPLDFIARLAALVPKPRFHLTRFHGVFAPNSKHRATVTGDGKEKLPPSIATEPPKDSEERHGKMSWAMRLKRVFNIDISVCRHCQGLVRIIACIEDRQVINQILAHINTLNQQKVPLARVTSGSGIRAPPTDLTYLIQQ